MVITMRLLYNFTPLNRRAFAMTETELRLMAAPASMGLRSKPKNEEIVAQRPNRY